MPNQARAGCDGGRVTVAPLIERLDLNRCADRHRPGGSFSRALSALRRSTGRPLATDDFVHGSKP
jgi:hypothetical protein